MHYTGMMALELPAYIVWSPGIVIASIVFGSVFGALALVVAVGRESLGRVAGAAVLLTIAAVLATAPEPMVLAMGVLNASMRRAGKVPVSLTFVTGMLVRFGQGLGDFLTRRSAGWNWLVQASPWVGLIAGATTGTAIYVRIGGAAIWVPVMLAGVLAASTVAIPQPD